MVTRLIAAWPLEGYQLWLTFADGIEGAVDLEAAAPGLPAAIPDLPLFRRARVDRAGNRVVWPNHASVEGERLYRILRRQQPRSLPARHR